MLDKYAGKKFINGMCVLASMVVVIPLLILGHYNYPSADDWSLGRFTHQAIQNGEGILGIAGEVVHTISFWREKGEPRYAAVLFAALQPGIFGEHFYRITPWIMIGGLFVSEILAGCYFLGKGKKWMAPIVIPSLLIQVLCVPFPVETFYWYTGSVNYTFVFSLSIILDRKSVV